MDAAPGASFSACPPRGAFVGRLPESQDVNVDAGSGHLEEGAEPLPAPGVFSYGAVPSNGPPLPDEIRAFMPDKVNRKLYANDDYEDSLQSQLRKNWPHYYTLACLAAFSAPVTASLHLARDASVHFWVGNWGYGALAVPGLLMLVHVYNVRRRELRMVPVICSTVMPAIILGVIANIHLNYIGQISHRLISKDCMTWQSKRNIQKSWLVAASLYEKCVNRTTAEHHLSFNDGLEFLRLQDCHEYAVHSPDIWASHRRDWAYLRRLEEEHECSGWCFHSAALWSFQGTKDACSITAGDVMTNRVDIVSQRMLSYALVVGILAILAIMQYGYEMRKRGVDWGLL